MSTNDRLLVLERKKGIPEYYERPLLYPVGDFEGDLMGDIVKVADPDAAIELDRMATFLKFALNVLKVKDSQGNELSLNEFWAECRNRIGESFVIRYAAYHYYRSKGWVVRSGHNFGVDFLLYKDGPEYNHSSYGVRILTDGDQIISSHFGALNRVMSTVRKELINCLVTVPATSEFDVSSPDCVRFLQIKELWTRTWMSEKNRD